MSTITKSFTKGHDLIHISVNNDGTWNFVICDWSESLDDRHVDCLSTSDLYPVLACELVDRIRQY